MAQLLQFGFGTEHDPFRHFVGTAPDTLELEALVSLFTRALRSDGVTGHMCCAVSDAGEAIPLVGDDPSLASTLYGQFAPSIAVEAPDGSPLTVRFAMSGPLTRPVRARLHALATIYAARALVLLEVAEKPVPGNMLTKAERECLRLAAVGWPCPDIGDRLDFSPPAIVAMLERTTTRLGAAGIAEAAAIASETDQVRALIC